MPPTLAEHSVNHWTTKEVPILQYFTKCLLSADCALKAQIQREIKYTCLPEMDSLLRRRLIYSKQEIIIGLQVNEP